MIQDKILYTDGRDVTITDTMFQVRNMTYRLAGITKHGLHILKPHRLPAFIVLVLGIGLMVTGLFNLMPNLIPPVSIKSVTLSGSAIMLIAGAAIMFIGLLVVGLLRERYAVRIATAEGEKDVIVSTQKEYITQIVNALNKAFGFLRTKK